MTEEVNLKFDLIFIHLALSSHTRLVATMLGSMGVSVASVDHALRTADVVRRADEGDHTTLPELVSNTALTSTSAHLES